jgi:hypothetical protein
MMVAPVTAAGWPARLIAELDASDARAIALARDLSLTQLNWKPAPAQWSVGQCLEHLAISNEIYGAALAEALTSAPAGVTDEIRPGWFARYFIREYIAPAEKPTRHKAPPQIRPVPDVDASILDRFLETNRTTRDLVKRAQQFDVNRVRFRNPFVGWIRFSVGTGLEILSKHEQRHLAQAERVRDNPQFPA